MGGVLSPQKLKLSIEAPIVLVALLQLWAKPFIWFVEAPILKWVALTSR